MDFGVNKTPESIQELVKRKKKINEYQSDRYQQLIQYKKEAFQNK